jgi:hypothetical protein
VLLRDQISVLENSNKQLEKDLRSNLDLLDKEKDENADLNLKLKEAINT